MEEEQRRFRKVRQQFCLFIIWKGKDSLQVLHKTESLTVYEFLQSRRVF